MCRREAAARAFRLGETGSAVRDVTMGAAVLKWGKLLGVLIALLFAVGAAAQEPVIIKFSHVLSPDSPKGRAALRFKELAESRSEGRVVVQVYPNGDLYRDSDELDALRKGAVQMLAPSLSKFRALGVHGLELFDLPYLFPNLASLHAVTDGDLGRELLKDLETRGIVGLAYWDGGFKHLSANWPLRQPVDCRGLRMRVQSSSVLEAQMRALRAVPVAMAFNKVHEALASGSLDGTESTLANFYGARIHETQKHLTLTGHGYLGYAVVVNKVFWQGLPHSLRSTLEDALHDATRYEREQAERKDNDALNKIKAAGTTRIRVPSAQELQSWREALLPVHRQFEKTIGKDRLAAVYRITEGGGDAAIHTK